MQTKKKINIKLNLELIPINTVKLILFYKTTLKGIKSIQDKINIWFFDQWLHLVRGNLF